MRRIFFVMILLLGGCNDPQKQSDTDLAMQSGQQTAEIQQLQDRMDKLENKEQGDKIATDMEQATASSSLDSLRDTVNNNVKVDNDRAKGTFSLIQTLDDRLARFDGQHATR